MEQKNFSVAIDGPAGAGKSTIARSAAARLGYVYVDTGAIYRTVTYGILRLGIDPGDPEAVAAALPNLKIRLTWDGEGLQQMHLNGENVSSQIRTPEISQKTSQLSAQPAVRDFLMETQRQTAREYCVVMDGRDIGTVVLPQAPVKIFLTASAAERARRRFVELEGKGVQTTYETVLREMEERDARDASRAVAPLIPAEDAVLLDTSALTLEESIEAVIQIIRKRNGAL